MDHKRKKVLCPVEGKNGKTHWIKLGVAFVNRDQSMNLYLDGLPVNGKLQVRDWDEEPQQNGRSQNFNGEQAPQNLLVGESDENNSF